MTNSQNDSGRTFDILSDIIDELFTKAFNKGDEAEESPAQAQDEQTPIYESIEEYTTQTGKRFRMTKDQKNRGLSREQAFNETFGGTN